MTSPLLRSFLAILERTAAVLGDREPGAASRLADRLGVGEVVARATGSGGPAGSAPERIATRWAEQLFLEAAAEASAALAARVVPHFFAKGIALVGRVYAAGERIMADIDLHVPPGARTAAVRTLEGLGYAELDEPEQDGPAALRPGTVMARGGETPGVDRVVVDLRWGVDPVERLLPRPDHPVPPVVWERIDHSGSLPVPSDAAHAALLIQHLVHHDLLHARGLLDLALVWQQLGPRDGGDVRDVAAGLGVGRATGLIAEVLERHFGLARPAGLGREPRGWRARAARRVLDPVAWLAAAARAAPAEPATVTLARLRRRLLLVDGPLPFGLLGDALWPPAEWLAWRWPGAGVARGRLRHLGSLARKLF